MTRLLILGGGGMLGHAAWLRLRDRFDTHVTLRGSIDDYPPIFDKARTIEHVDADHFDRAIDAAKPDVVLNCIGIIKQLEAAHDPIASITINSLFPHRVAAHCKRSGARMIHVSTDCVFSGTRGMSRESDNPDPVDLYGRSKLLGEVDAPALTLRTSIIGRELRGADGLVAWFLSMRGKTVKGYRNAIFSGVTTTVLADLIGDVIEKHPTLSGLYHVSADPIAKYDLLHLLRDALAIDVEIEPSDEPRIDRSLDSSRFRAATDWTPPSWPVMVRGLTHE